MFHTKKRKNISETILFGDDEQKLPNPLLTLKISTPFNGEKVSEISETSLTNSFLPKPPGAYQELRAESCVFSVKV